MWLSIAFLLATCACAQAYYYRRDAPERGLVSAQAKDILAQAKLKREVLVLKQQLVKLDQKLNGQARDEAGQRETKKLDEPKQGWEYANPDRMTSKIIKYARGWSI